MKPEEQTDADRFQRERSSRALRHRAENLKAGEQTQTEIFALYQLSYAYPKTRDGIRTRDLVIRIEVTVHYATGPRLSKIKYSANVVPTMATRQVICLNVRLPTATHERIKRAAITDHRSINEEIVVACEELWERLVAKRKRR